MRAPEGRRGPPSGCKRARERAISLTLAAPGESSGEHQRPVGNSPFLLERVAHLWQTHGRRTSWSSVISGGASPNWRESGWRVLTRFRIHRGNKSSFESAALPQKIQGFMPPIYHAGESPYCGKNPNWGCAASSPDFGGVLRRRLSC